jgi:uncharacterized protein YjbI with pentapeptide repeats
MITCLNYNRISDFNKKRESNPFIFLNLSGKDLSRKNLKEANLSDVNLSGVNLTNADLSYA